MAWFPMALAGTLRVVLVGGMLLFLFPRLILPARPSWSRPDRWAAAGMMGLFLVEVVGHVLVPLRLYEFLGILLVLTGLVLLLRYRRGGKAALLAVVEVPLYRLLAALDRIGATAAKPGSRSIRIPSIRIPAVRLSSWPEAATFLLGASTVVVAVFTRLTFALLDGAPAPSDYLEHLQWSGWLARPDGLLMPDFVYPRGMNMVHAALRFVTQEELHVVVKVAGPLLNLLTIAGIWYVVRAATGSRVGALVAAAFYAMAPTWIPTEWGRQATPLPQEFAMALILPAAWWGYRYLERRDRLDLILAASGALVVAATHWIALIYLALAFIVVAMSRPDRFRGSMTLGLSVAGATVAGLLPQVIAFLNGVPLLETAAGFITGEANQLVVPFRLGSGLLVVLILAACALGARTEPARRLLPGFLVGSLVIYFLPHLGLASPAIATRSWDFLALAIAAALGAGFAGLEQLGGARVTPGVAAVAGLVLVSLVWVSSPPRVLRLEPELTQEYTMQIMKLRREYVPGHWMTVGRPEQLALVQNAGLQQDATTFTRAIPEPPRPGAHIADAMIAAGLVDKNARRTQVPDVFLFVEQRPYISTASKASGRGDLTLKENETLARWVELYLQNHPDTEIYYQSPSLTIYRIPAPEK